MNYSASIIEPIHFPLKFIDHSKRQGANFFALGLLAFTEETVVLFH
jgi:hypothetical protein